MNITPSLYNIPKKEIIVVNTYYLPQEDKQSDFETVKTKYDALFEGYIVAYIDAQNLNQSIYKL